MKTKDSHSNHHATAMQLMLSQKHLQEPWGRICDSHQPHHYIPSALSNYAQKVSRKIIWHQFKPQKRI